MTAVVVRCDRHTGDVWPSRCGACESLNAEYQALGITETNSTRTKETPMPENDEITLMLLDQLKDRLSRLEVAYGITDASNDTAVN